METKERREVKERQESQPEWEKPSVKELDINAITLSGFTGTGMDNSFYS